MRPSGSNAFADGIHDRGPEGELIKDAVGPYADGPQAVASRVVNVHEHRVETRVARTRKRAWWLVLVCISAALLWRRVSRRSGRVTARPYAGSAPRREGVATPEETVDSTSAPPPVAEAPAPETPQVEEEVEVAAAGEIDLAEAARILGCPSEEATALLDGRPLTRAGAEELALEHYRWRRHVDDPDSYWVTLKQASTILGVPAQRVKQMLESGEVPFVVHRDGVRLMRRAELAR